VQRRLLLIVGGGDVRSHASQQSDDIQVSKSARLQKQPVNVRLLFRLRLEDRGEPPSQPKRNQLVDAGVLHRHGIENSGELPAQHE